MPINLICITTVNKGQGKHAQSSQHEMALRHIHSNVWPQRRYVTRDRYDDAMRRVTVRWRASRCDILPMSGIVETAVGVESASNRRSTKKATNMLMPDTHKPYQRYMHMTEVHAEAFSSCADVADVMSYKLRNLLRHNIEFTSSGLKLS